MKKNIKLEFPSGTAWSPARKKEKKFEKEKKKKKDIKKENKERKNFN